MVYNPSDPRNALAQGLIDWTRSPTAKLLEFRTREQAAESLGYLYLKILPRTGRMHRPEDIQRLVCSFAPFYFQNYCREQRQFRIIQPARCEQDEA